jgi:hypothetical protein
MSDAYPSRAAWYESEVLMSMAGTLAETAESELNSLLAADPKSGHPLTRIIARALIGNAYASLAQAASMRERTELVTDVLSAEPEET